MPVVSGLPINPATKSRRWPLTSRGRELPRDPSGRLMVRIEMIAQSLKQAHRHMFSLTRELEAAAPRMRHAEKKKALEFLRIMHEGWIMTLSAVLSRDAFEEGRRVLSQTPDRLAERPKRRKRDSVADAWLRRQLEGIGRSPTDQAGR